MTQISQYTQIKINLIFANVGAFFNIKIYSLVCMRFCKIIAIK